MTETTNLNLQKFEDGDSFNPDVLNANWDKVDGAFVLKDGVLTVASAKQVYTDVTTTAKWLHNKTGECVVIVPAGSSTFYPNGIIGIQANDGVTIGDKNGNAGAPMRCGSVYINGSIIHSSSEKTKTNIVDYDGALDLVLGLNVKEYDRINEDIHQIGLVVEDSGTPDKLIAEFTMPEFDAEGNIIGAKIVKGVDIYSFGSLVARGVQEHYAKTEAETTEAQLSIAESYEEMEARETATQLAMAELYEMMIGEAA